MPTVDPTIASWQANQREIGMLEFFPTESAAKRFPYYQLSDSSTFPGLLEFDALCMLTDGTICLYDHDVVDRVLCAAAPNQSSLISALTEMDAFFDRCKDDDDLANDESANIQIREKCTELVGGDAYAAFMQLFFWA